MEVTILGKVTVLQAYEDANGWVQTHPPMSIMQNAPLIYTAVFYCTVFRGFSVKRDLLC